MWGPISVTRALLVSLVWYAPMRLEALYWSYSIA